MIYRVFCDKCGLDKYIKAEVRPDWCPKCGETELFMSSIEKENDEEELLYSRYGEETVWEFLEKENNEHTKSS